MKSFNVRCIFIAALLMLSACGQSFDSSTNTASNPGGSTAEDGQGGDVINPPVENIPQLKGIVASGTYADEQVLGLDAKTGELILSVPLGRNVRIGLGETPISGLPGARVYTSDSVDGKKYLVLIIPLKHVLRGVSGGPSSRLPNGDAIPYMPGGELPQWGLAVDGDDKVKIHIYAGYDSVGVFVESSFDPFIRLEYDIRDKHQGKVGVLALIPKKGQYQGGFFVGVRMADELARLLDKLIK